MTRIYTTLAKSPIVTGTGGRDRREKDQPDRDEDDHLAAPRQ